MVISPPSIAERIERFIRRSFDVAVDDPVFTRDVHLFEAGFLDSVGFAELLAFIEATFGVALDAEELFSEDCTSVNGVSRLIAMHLAQAGRQQGRPAGRSG
jgi:acyl carrier protein